MAARLRPIAVPMKAEDRAALGRQSGKHPDHVFTFRGEPIKQINAKAWQQALKRVGISVCRWHGLRHTWASWNRTRIPTICLYGAYMDRRERATISEQI